MRLASLQSQVGLFDAPAKAASILTDTSAAACQNEPFEERFVALDDHSAPFDRFASADDCAASFDERFGLAMRVLASSLRLPPDQRCQAWLGVLARFTAVAERNSMENASFRHRNPCHTNQASLIMLAERGPAGARNRVTVDLPPAKRNVC